MHIMIPTRRVLLIVAMLLCWQTYIQFVIVWFLCFIFNFLYTIYKQSLHRESAMALNSMYPDGWFALGAAALKVTYKLGSFAIL